MEPDVSAPGAGDWAAGLLRGFSLVRWPLCVVGIFLTGLSFAGAQACFEANPPSLLAWWQQPLDNAATLGADLWGSLARTIFGGGLLLAVNGMVWGLLGGWIARHELYCRQRALEDDSVEPLQLGPYTFLAGRWRPLQWSCTSLLGLALVCLLPLLLAGWVNGWFGGRGCVVVAAVLPFPLLFALGMLFAAAAAVAWPLTLAALAAECGKATDAVQRSRGYAFGHPILFVLLTAVAVGLALLPWGVVYLLRDTLDAWQAERRQSVYLLATGLSLSIFWSLQTLVYLHLRAVIDKVDASRVASGPPPAEEPKAPRGFLTPPTMAKPAAAPASVVGALWGALAGLVFVAGSWCLTSYLLMRVGGGPTSWLDGGLLSWSVAPAQDLGGAYVTATILAGVYGVAFLIYLLWGVRRALAGDQAAAPADAATLEFFRQLNAGNVTAPGTCPRLVEYLGHPNIGVRYQAYHHLLRLVPAGKSFGYKVWGSAGSRAEAIAKWQQLIPPLPPGPPGTQAGSPGPASE
jgi:hypothetical protein